MRGLCAFVSMCVRMCAALYPPSHQEDHLADNGSFKELEATAARFGIDSTAFDFESFDETFAATAPAPTHAKSAKPVVVDAKPATVIASTQSSHTAPSAAVVPVPAPAAHHPQPTPVAVPAKAVSVPAEVTPL